MCFYIHSNSFTIKTEVLYFANELMTYWKELILNIRKTIANPKHLINTATVREDRPGDTNVQVIPNQTWRCPSQRNIVLNMNASFNDETFSYWRQHQACRHNAKFLRLLNGGGGAGKCWYFTAFFRFEPRSAIVAKSKYSVPWDKCARSNAEKQHSNQNPVDWKQIFQRLTPAPYDARSVLRVLRRHVRQRQTVFR